MTVRHRVARTVAALVVAASGLAWSPVGAAAGPVVHAQQQPRITMVAQPLSVEAGGTATFVVHVDGQVPDGATVTVISYRRARTRGEVREAIDRGVEGQPLDIVEYELALLPLQDGNVVLNVPTQVSREAVEPLYLRDAGLYPISIQIRVDDEPVASMLTFLERLGDTPPAAVVHTAVGLSVDAAPTLLPNGTTRVTDETRAAIDRLLEILELHTAVPITVTIRPELLDGLSRSGLSADTTRLERLGAALRSGHQLLASTYVAMDPARAIADDLGIEFTEQLRKGEDAVRETLGLTVDRITWLLRDPIGTEGTDLLRLFGVKQIVAASTIRDDLPPRDGAIGAVSGSDGVVLPALVGDLVVQARLAQPGVDPVLSGHHVLADLLAMSIEAETVADDEGDPVRPLGVFIDLGSVGDVADATLDAVLSSLDDSARLAAGTAADTIETLDVETPRSLVDRFPMKPVAAGDTELAVTLTRLRDAVISTATMLPDDDVRAERWAELTDVFVADNLTPTERAAYTRQLDGEIGELRSCVTVVTSSRVQLGGRESRVPVTLVNECDTPLTVRVRLNGPKLELREPDQLETVIDRTQLEIPVAARTNGIFPVEVELLTPGGEPPVQLRPPNEFTVQASALTGLGQVVSGALVLVLVTWWVQHVRIRRRRSRAEQAAAHVGGHPAARADAGPIT